MNSLQMLRVHIAPVGFELDRIVLPAIRMKADIVWLSIREKNTTAKISHIPIRHRVPYTKILLKIRAEVMITILTITI
ncbi:MAG: DUF6293 family protein [Candidatus Nitrosopolaris sp.]|jgi:hypothetical protein